MIEAMIVSAVSAVVMVALFALIVLRVIKDSTAAIASIAERLLMPTRPEGTPLSVALSDTSNVTSDPVEVVTEAIHHPYEDWPEGWGVSLPIEEPELTEEEVAEAARIMARTH